MSMPKPKYRPIIFSEPMVRAILEGRKTRTMRIMGFELHDDPSSSMPLVDLGPTQSGVGRIVRSLRLDDCPYGSPGDRLWVCEWWRYSPSGQHVYKADANRSHASEPWITPNGMPIWASRIMLEITGVRAMRVQDITLDEINAEGVPVGDDCAERDPFLTLWDTIHGPGAWARNDWVWAITFERVEQESKQ